MGQSRICTSNVETVG